MAWLINLATSWHRRRGVVSRDVLKCHLVIIIMSINTGEAATLRRSHEVVDKALINIKIKPHSIIRGDGR